MFQARRAAELDFAEAELWYETQRSGLGNEFHSGVSEVIDRLAETPLNYQVVYRDILWAFVHRFPFLIWFRVLGEVVIVLSCIDARQEPGKTMARFQ